MPAAPLRPTLRVLPHIRRALETGSPVVALESSVFAQGLPAPENGDAARRMMIAVERAGATPAITAVVQGEPTLGLESEELERFLRRENIRKVSARDLGPAIAQCADGATTVAASLAIATRAGASVFATGGIGGVHRAPIGHTAGSVRDESADLAEMAHTPMVVVCAGAKSILDLPATWERLDTLGIPVIGVGTDEFPGFYTAKTAIRLTVAVDTADEVAEIAAAHFACGRMQSVLVVQPPPANVALNKDDLERAVEAALSRAAHENVSGGALTPYLLAEVARRTGGRALAANVALLEANARLAADVAVTLVTIRAAVKR